MVTMEADKASYPSLPFSAACSLGGDTLDIDTLDIDVVAMDPTTDPALAQVTIDDSGAVEIHRGHDSFSINAFPLPDCDTEFIVGTYLTPGLSGVRCRVRHDTDGVWRVRVQTSSSAAIGARTCNLPRAGGASMDLEVTVVEGPS